MMVCGPEGTAVTEPFPVESWESPDILESVDIWSVESRVTGVVMGTVTSVLAASESE